MASKIQELIFLEWFLQEAGLDCEVLEDDRESPDFVVDLDGIRTGIEQTQIFSDSSVESKVSTKRKSESRNSNWLKKLAHLYYGKDLFPITLSVSFSDQPSNLDGLTEPILEELAKCKLGKWEETNLDFEDGVCRLSILRLDDKFGGYDRWKIINDHVAFVQPITIEHFERAIQIKTTKIEDYRQHCERIWLLTIADTTWNSGRFDMRLPIETIDSAFDELWFGLYPRSVERLTK